MEENLNEKNKGRKGLIVTIIILILLLLGSLGYIAYDKGYLDKLLGKEEPVKQEVKKEELVKGYEFRLKDIECKENDKKTCTKELKVAYNGKNHDVKITRYEKMEEEKLEDSDETATVDNVYFDLYVDGQRIDKINSGNIYVDPETNKPDDGYNSNFDGFIYIFNDKYLGFLFETTAPAGSPGYVLNLYDENKKIDTKISNDGYDQTDNGVVIKVHGQGFGKNDSDFSDISNLKFDGTVLKYWWLSCDKLEESENDESATDIAVQLALTFDGNEVSIKSTDKKENVTAGGAAGICFDTKTNSFEN